MNALLSIDYNYYSVKQWPKQNMHIKCLKVQDYFQSFKFFYQVVYCPQNSLNTCNNFDKLKHCMSNGF